MTGVSAPLFDRLAVLDDLTPHRAAFNMAQDEVMLAGLAATPALRLYRWEKPAVSFGYFTPYGVVLSDYPDREAVRRWTGGGVVEHGEDVTFSLLVPRSHPLSNGPAGNSYCLIHRALQSAFLRLGWADTILEENKVGVSSAAAACFGNPVRHDLVCSGQKISGGAQRRTRHGLLHQGSINATGAVGWDAEKVRTFLTVSFAEQWTAYPMLADEARAAERLAREKYGAEEWLHRV